MTPKSLYIYSSKASVLIPVYAGIRNYKALNRPFKILFYFFVLCILFEIMASYLKWKYKNNMPGLHVYTIVEFLTFSMVFYLHLQKSGWLRRLMIINAIIFLIAAIITMCRNAWIPNDHIRSYSAACMILYTLGYLYYLFNKDDTHHMQEYPMFWICIGILVYFATNYTYFIANGYLLKEHIKVDWWFHFLHAGLNIITYCLYAQSFRCLGKQKTAIQP